MEWDGVYLQMHLNEEDISTGKNFGVNFIYFS